MLPSILVTRKQAKYVIKLNDSYVTVLGNANVSVKKQKIKRKDTKHECVYRWPQSVDEDVPCDLLVLGPQGGDALAVRGVIVLLLEVEADISRLVEQNQQQKKSLHSARN